MKNRIIFFLRNQLVIWGVTISVVLTAGCGQRYELLLADEPAAGSDQKAQDSRSSDKTQTVGEVKIPEGGAESDPTDENTAEGASDSGAAEESVPGDGAAADKLIYVYVCGAVMHPGVYELPEQSRVYQAIDAAGGLLEEADTKLLNQAQQLTDGQQIIVYTEEEAEAISLSGEILAGAAAGDMQTADARINLNTASREELMTLSGVGEARADAIISYREQHGGFSSIEEIMQIEGIAEKSFEKLRDQITV